MTPVTSIDELLAERENLNFRKEEQKWFDEF
jgi:hypothetical protein